SGIIPEKEIEILTIAPQNDRNVSVSTCKIAVLRSAVYRISAGEDNPEIEKGLSPVMRDQGSDFRCRELHLAAQAGWLVMIPGVDRVVLVHPRRLDPVRKVGGPDDLNGLRIPQAGLACSGAPYGSHTG